MKKDQDIIAKEIISLLDESAQGIDSSVAARLSGARRQAVARMQQAQSVAGHGGLTHLMNEFMHQHRVLVSAGLLCSAILVAFVVTQQFSQDALEQSDAFLLGSELPPEAFLDKGFDTWVEQSSEH